MVCRANHSCLLRFPRCLKTHNINFSSSLSSLLLRIYKYNHHAYHLLLFYLHTIQFHHTSTTFYSAALPYPPHTHTHSYLFTLFCMLHLYFSSLTNIFLSPPSFMTTLIHISIHLLPFFRLYFSFGVS